MYGLTDGDILSLATDDPVDADEFDEMIDRALDGMMLLNSLPYIIDEDPMLLMSVFRVWRVDAAAFSEACILSGVEPSIIAEVHDRCCNIFDAISALVATDQNVEEANRN